MSSPAPPAAQIPRWPKITATLNADGTGHVTIAGNTEDITAADIDRARALVIERVSHAATEVGRAVRLDTTDPDGEWELAVNPDGSVEEIAAHPSSPPADPSSAKVAVGDAFAEPWFDEDADPLRRRGQGRAPSDRPPPPDRARGLTRPRTAPPSRRPGARRTAARRDVGLRRRLLRVLAGLLAVGVLILAVRGLADTLGDDRSSPASAQPAGVNSAQGWPDDEARAFTIQFARAFLTFSPERPDYHELAVKPFVAKRLRGALAIPKRGADQTVSTITVARARATARDRATITVAATVLNKTVTTRYLTVPVARDDNGGLVVYDYPAFSPAPATADVASDEQTPLDGSEAGTIRRFMRRFLKAYLRGTDLAAFTTPDAGLTPLSQPYVLRKVVEISQVGETEGDQRTVAVVVRARDRATGADYTLRYRTQLVLRQDRWYVRTLDGTARNTDR